MTDKEWDKAHQEGKVYTPVSEIVLDEILSPHPQSASILDVGCGSGVLTRQLHARGYHVSGVDLSFEAIRKAEADNPGGITYALADFMNYQPRRKFDVIFINLVLAFAKDRQAFLDHARSLLKNNGQIVLITPVLSSRYVAKYSPHLRQISIPMAELKQLLPNGWNKVESHYFADYGACYTLVLL